MNARKISRNGIVVIGTVFVDAFLKLAHSELADCEPILKALDELGRKHNVNFVLSLSADPDEVPLFMKGYLI